MKLRFFVPIALFLASLLSARVVLREPWLYIVGQNPVKEVVTEDGWTPVPSEGSDQIMSIRLWQSSPNYPKYVVNCPTYTNYFVSPAVENIYTTVQFIGRTIFG